MALTRPIEPVSSQITHTGEKLRASSLCGIIETGPGSATPFVDGWS